MFWFNKHNIIHLNWWKNEDNLTVRLWLYMIFVSHSKPLGMRCFPLSAYRKLSNSLNWDEKFCVNIPELNEMQVNTKCSVPHERETVRCSHDDHFFFQISHVLLCMNHDKPSQHRHRGDDDEANWWQSILEVEWGLNELKFYQCTKFLSILKMQLIVGN